jgi:uncharacterized protein (TIGR03083 family)
MATISSPGVPPLPDPLPYDALGQLRTDAVGILELVARHGLDHPVPTCPGWRLGDLAWHLGKVWNRWAHIVAEGLTTSDEVAALDEAVRPGDDLLLDWVSTAHTALYSALTRSDDSTEVWTWTGEHRQTNRPVSWVRRRMAQETAMHRWDVANAVGVPYEIPDVVAADGIDEFLMWFASRRKRDGAAPVGGTVHLHCTDTDGEWLVTHLDESGIAFTREHAKGDTAVRGRANDLLLWLWGRAEESVELLGDVAVAERFRGFPAL